MGGASEGGDKYSRIKDEHILEVFLKADSPALSTSEVEEQLPLGADQTRERLRRLEDQGFVHSKQVGKPLIWWHNDVQLLFEDDSTASTSGSHIAQIGVEVIDSLDLPGGGLELHARRKAVDGVYRHLFRYNEAVHSNLKEIAWETYSRETYSSPDNLWNDCIHPALRQPPFFGVNKAEDKWLLIGLGKDIKDKFSHRCLWQNWPIVRFYWEYIIYECFWMGVNESIGQEHPYLNPQDAERTSFHVIQLRDVPAAYLLLEVEFTEPFWLNLAGRLECQLIVAGEPDTEHPLEHTLDTLQSNFSFDVSWEHEKYQDQYNLVITASNEFERDPADVPMKIRKPVHPLDNQVWIQVIGKEFRGFLQENM